MNQFFQDVIFILNGVFLTLQLTLGGLVIGLVLGLFISITRYNGYFVFFINVFISIIRGTPLLLQLSFFYFFIPSFLSIEVDIVVVGVLSLGINSAAYVAEVLRGGIESVPKGQFEAAVSLRISPFYKWFDIILPQVFRNVFPSLVNELIALIKETAIISTIGGVDLMRRAQIIAASRFTYFIPMCVSGVCYYFLIFIVEYLARIIKKKILY